jgi:hypothetical protein
MPIVIGVAGNMVGGFRAQATSNLIDCFEFPDFSQKAANPL